MWPYKRRRLEEARDYDRVHRRSDQLAASLEDAPPAISHSRGSRHTHSQRRDSHFDRQAWSSKRDIPLKNGGKPVAKHHSLRAQTRSLEKLLSRADSNMPADVRQDKERELGALKLDLQAQEEKKERSTMIKRYHFIRFLERQRAEKTLKKLTRENSVLAEQLQNTSDTAKAKSLADRLERVRDRAATARVDAKYAQYAPLGEPYISLYPSDRSKRGAKRSEDNKQEQDRVQEQQSLNDDFECELGKDLQAGIVPSHGGGKPPLWFDVAKHALSGETGLQALENMRDRTGRGKGAIAKAVRQGSGSEPAKQVMVMKRRRSEREADVEVDDREESDGGFFE